MEDCTRLGGGSGLSNGGWSPTCSCCSCWPICGVLSAAWKYGWSSKQALTGTHHDYYELCPAYKIIITVVTMATSQALPQRKSSTWSSSREGTTNIHFSQIMCHAYHLFLGPTSFYDILFFMLVPVPAESTQSLSTPPEAQHSRLSNIMTGNHLDGWLLGNTNFWWHFGLLCGP
jgi:hypothetical protein